LDALWVVFLPCYSVILTSPPNSVGVELLIYVFDIESETPDHDFDHFCGVLEAIEENSPDARIFLLIHKMDLVAPEDREAILEDRKRLIAESCLSCGVENFSCFGTSIWDVSLVAQIPSRLC
jgi:Ras-related GTP-binding protein A/B